MQQFGIEVGGKVCADIGACTGGFTDVLLQARASRVYAIDVGYGQLDWKIRQDARVVVMERTNERYLASLPEQVRFASVDVSFISLRLILPSIQQWLTPHGQVVALIKPQFEAGPESVGKGGVKGRSRMPFTENESISLRIRRICRIDVQRVPVGRHQQIHTGHR